MDSYLHKDKLDKLNQFGQGGVFELGLPEYTSLVYHNLFDYPLNLAELIKWSAGEKAKIQPRGPSMVYFQQGFFCLHLQKGLVLKRALNKRASQRKLKKIKKTLWIFKLVPSLKLLAITGSLAMENAKNEDDIDLLVVTAKDRLWLTRLLTYGLLILFGISLRRAGKEKEKDKFCLNIWLDESSLAWPQAKRNIFTAHEIAQTKPLINKNQTYERFLWQNRWLKKYWPNSVRIKQTDQIQSEQKNFLLKNIERLAFQLQYWYMKSKMTRETISLNRALFHPVDWSKNILELLDKGN